jgi:hypothetical protein
LALTFHVHLLAITQNIPRSQALVELAAPRPHLTYYEAACDGCGGCARARASRARIARIVAAAPPPARRAGRRRRRAAAAAHGRPADHGPRAMMSRIMVVMMMTMMMFINSATALHSAGRRDRSRSSTRRPQQHIAFSVAFSSNCAMMGHADWARILSPVRSNVNCSTEDSPLAAGAHLLFNMLNCDDDTLRNMTTGVLEAAVALRVPVFLGWDSQVWWQVWRCGSFVSVP